ncbi:MAG: hypothetical protein KDA89_17880, partial [Planctomycetaceae bacterium]|nr:hypothetical protein [Planctomycetaceae bacterium]
VDGLGWVRISSAHIPVLMAGLALLMSAVTLPDRLINGIPRPGSLRTDADRIHNRTPAPTLPATSAALFRHRDAETGVLTENSLLLQRRDGTDRNLVQTAGGLAAMASAVHWLTDALQSFSEWPTAASAQQFGFLLAALVLFTFRNPNYAGGFWLWTLTGFAAVRTAVGTGCSAETILEWSACLAAGISIMTAVILRTTGLRTREQTASNHAAVMATTNCRSHRRTQRWNAFLSPLCDLTSGTLLCLAVVIYVPLLVLQHAAVFFGHGPEAILLTSVTAVAFWFPAMARIRRNKAATIVAVIVLPAWTTLILVNSHLLPAAGSVVVWSLWFGGLAILSQRRLNELRPAASVTALGLEDPCPAPAPCASPDTWRTISNVSRPALTCLLLISCLTFSWAARMAAAVALGGLLIADRRTLSLSDRSWLAVMASFQSLLLAAAAAGYHGVILNVMAGAPPVAAAPLLLLATSISLLVFFRLERLTDETVVQSWTSLLRVAAGITAVAAAAGPLMTGPLMLTTLAGFAVFITAEFLQAVRRQTETHVWTGLGTAGLAAFFLFAQGYISLGAGLSQFVLLTLSAAALTTAHFTAETSGAKVFCRPMKFVGQTLPAVVAVFG